MKRKVLLLDVDYTVINTDSMIDFLFYSFKNKFLKTLLNIPYILLMLILYVFKVVSLKKAKEAVFSPIVNFSEDDLEYFFKNNIKTKMNKSIIDIIKKSKEEDMYIIMITASPNAYMKYFQKYGFADEIIATNLRYNNGYYINEIIGNNCKGNEKVARIYNLLKEKNIEIDYKNSYAYSDSISDLPMLRLVNNAYLVNKKDGTIVKSIKREN